MADKICKFSRLLRKNHVRFSQGCVFSSQANRNIQSEAKDGVTSEQETHFGFQTVSEAEKEEKVYHVFENVASKYDLMNDMMSVGIHRLWKDTFIDRLGPRPNTKLIDVAGGTGDIAFRFLKYSQTVSQKDNDNSDSSAFEIEQTYNVPFDELSQETQSEDHQLSDEGSEQAATHVTVCDINQAMLDVGKEKAIQLGYKKGISWLLGNAEQIPVPDNSYDAFTIAFGIRNCTHVDKVVAEAFRVLKPGGRFMCLEFSQVHPLLRSFYDNYSFQVIPVLGQVIAGDWKSYQYLVESIRQFPNQEDFAEMIRCAGFSAVTYENLTFGVAAIHSGFKL